MLNKLRIHDYNAVYAFTEGNKFGHVIKMVMVNPVSSLNKFGSNRVPDVVHQISRSSVSWFRRKRFLKVFIIYGTGSHLGHMPKNI